MKRLQQWWDGHFYVNLKWKSQVKDFFIQSHCFPSPSWEWTFNLKHEARENVFLYGSIFQPYEENGFMKKTIFLVQTEMDSNPIIKPASNCAEMQIHFPLWTISLSAIFHCMKSCFSYVFKLSDHPTVNNQSSKILTY